MTSLADGSAGIALAVALAARAAARPKDPQRRRRCDHPPRTLAACERTARARRILTR